ncbi:hypothetical protein IVG45_16490 [Methylomonas sp. LL1]|uniref:hypothetical protein n=1 Tax=Methylomonas sp. LL1 TaxID=2785785 RepID=UPI0018C445FD|nr:hypothetical protein [Methylomonas sp. LL1]QPK62438.1 hypothetical protein IVG45_16490 [Methylomonas sp. LL1]
MKKFNKTPLTLAMGTAVISGFAVNANAESNPFAMNELSSGYMVAAASNKSSHGACGGNVADANGNKINGAHKEDSKIAAKTKKAEGSCGEGMCGGMMQGGKMKKGMEGMCGEMMKGKEGACGMMGGMGGMNHGDDQKAKTEEGSCGAMMKGDDAKKGAEGSCGGMMKGGEGSCGSKVDADKAAGE